jgi:hypothetical protein
MAQAKTQNPKRIDTAIGWTIIAGAAMVLTPILARNIEPYQSAIFELAPGIIRWIMRLPVVGWAIATVAFAAVQAAEVWPLLSEETAEELNSPVWRRAMSTRWVLAAIAYGIDALMCARYWPILREGVSAQMLIAGFNLRLINQGAFVQTILTLFGCTLFILLYRYVRRIA